MSGGLYMARIPFRGQRLFEFARRRGLTTWELDHGYAVHCALRELFGDGAPKPFFLAPTTGPVQPVLGYGPRDREGLWTSAQLRADPWLWEHLVDWDGLAAKPMPSSWRAGQRLGFTVRAVPVARAAKDHVPPAAEASRHRAGSEVDVFLLACRGEPDAVIDREAVYRQWLHAQVKRLGGATLEEVRIESFQVDRFARRHHREDVRKLVKGRPAVTFEGTLTVTDGEQFEALLARGVGRHRAFGFGMLLLRPPGG